MPLEEFVVTEEVKLMGPTGVPQHRVPEITGTHVPTKVTLDPELAAERPDVIIPIKEAKKRKIKWIERYHGGHVEKPTEPPNEVPF